ncbi:hypothetical protein UVI_02049540 [Ustilaginoidea virens]|uniref:5'-Nucleotidase C-terminal domain-containing protein n=1 Tax=Ustilaginoidea virens TaxID=1159556 RepID=A0A1B5KZC9_USTVR|nr:hypothetical protein UVI_02049540 [Ustilaginoidea virens]
MPQTNTKKGLSSEPQVIYSSGRVAREAQEPPDVRILHYNDVYHVDSASAEPVGGLARFMTLCREHQEDEAFRNGPNVLTLFSGDAFNPSLESSVTKEDVPIGNARRTHMLTTSNGVKVGLIGLGEREWLATINSLPPNLVYKSASATARELVPQLRAQGAEMVICLSHMREPNDNKLAEQTDGLIDVILGGHDHYYSHGLVKGAHVLRSGTDFKQLSYVEARRKPGGATGWDVDIWRRDVTSEVAEHGETAKLVAQLTSQLQKSLSRPIGWTAVPLDARFSTVRTRESNMGNFVCDVMRRHHDADCCVMASGTIRGDQVYPPGVIRIKDVTTCLPFEDPVVCLRVKGQAIWDALENGVSTYPAQEGRFPQVSNIVFEFDPSRESGRRLNLLRIGGRPYDPQAEYVLATRGYMGRGKEKEMADGYTSLLVESEGGAAEEIVDEENGILISAMLRQYFMALRTVGQWKRISDHWVDVASEPLSPSHARRSGRMPSLPGTDDDDNDDAARPAAWKAFLRRRLGLHKEPLDDDDDDHFDPRHGRGRRVVDEEEPDEDAEMDLEILLMRKFWARWAAKAGVKATVCEPLEDVDCLVDWTRVIAPAVEGRIRMVGVA